MAEEKKELQNSKLSFEDFKKEVIADYQLANESRQASLIGRKEVLTGKAKFGIFGDGKEIAQIAMSKVFKNGDFRSGYYRDQTFAFASGMSNINEFFAQLYADTDIINEPASGGRSMNGHFATRFLDKNGNWLEQTDIKNSSADISPTGSQMPRLLGLAYASKLYRENKHLHEFKQFSDKGNEVAFGTIGNASTAEGMFFESVNAGGVLMIPMAISIWDDGYGISVPNKYQITKQDISKILKGFEYEKEAGQGYLLYSCKGWDYPSLIQMYKEGIDQVRKNHIPAIFHITEVTQPQGHSTSGSHERYKSKERLEWEKEYDCIVKMREWMLESAIATAEELDKIEDEAKNTARKCQKEAFEAYLYPIKQQRDEVNNLLLQMAEESNKTDALKDISKELARPLELNKKTVMQAVFKALYITRNENNNSRDKLIEWKNSAKERSYKEYSSYLYSESNDSALKVKEVKPEFNDSSRKVDGREVMLAYFDKLLERDPRVFAIGEDVGKIGDVNQGMAGLQEKYGEIRVSDTGIRELTIVGQGIGAAMRGLRPIVEIQYLDYLLYALQIISDDLATVRYRSAGGQKAPLIIRTRGHRLEGIWHSGSPMGAIINSFRGLYVCVPRNMVQAAGMYNTIMHSEEPALIIERLNAYRMKELLPENIGEYTIPLGVPEIIEEGSDVTIVTYGACVDIAKDAVNKLKDADISCELIDVQTLLPFDINNSIVESIKKTNRVLFLDEDVPGGASAYMMQQVIEKQKAYYYLDSEPVTLAAKEHRPAYGTDGDYFSKPNAEDIFESVYNLMHEYDPGKYPEFLG